MKNQSIVEYGVSLQETEQETPTPRGTEVLLRITSCGVCHSDIHVHDGYFDLGGGQKMDHREFRQLPFTLGHEIGGEVVALGPEAEAVQVGDKVVAYPWIGCGECPICARGDGHLCDRPRQIGVTVPGGFSDHVLVPHSRYLFDYSGIEDSLAALYMCAGLTAFSALKKAGEVGPRDKILIVGQGGVGMMALQFAKALFNQSPLVAEINETKLDLAMQADAGGIYNTAEPEALAKLKADTGGGVQVALDFVGSEESVTFSVNALQRRGKAIIVGLLGGAFSIPLPLLVAGSISIVGSFVGSLKETREMLDLVKAGKVKPIPFEERPLEQANKSLDDLREGRVIGRVVLKP